MKVAVLCSGFGLGFYIPGLLAARRLEHLGHTVETYVFEDLMENEKKNNIRKTKSAYHQNFRTAIFANKMDMDIADSIDDGKCRALFDRWNAAHYDYFIVLSGHWIYVIQQYERILGCSLSGHVDLLYVDSDYSPSWRNQRKFYPIEKQYREIWLMNAEKGIFQYYIPIESDEVIPYEKRTNQLLIHGGGWGMGDYRKAVDALSKTDYRLNLVLYGREDLTCKPYDVTCYMNDPEWEPWQRDARGCHTFPPFSEVWDTDSCEFRTFYRHHGLYDVVSRVSAVIAKPGAGSIIDAIASETPLLYTTPVGRHEQQNAGLLEKYKIGMSYESWYHNGCSEITLLQLYKQISMLKQSLAIYPDF